MASTLPLWESPAVEYSGTQFPKRNLFLARGSLALLAAAFFRSHDRQESGFVRSPARDGIEKDRRGLFLT